MNNERLSANIETLEEEFKVAQVFHNLHVRIYSDEEFEEYVRAQCKAWEMQAWRAESDHTPAPAMWLRRNPGNESSHFGAVVDYVIPFSKHELRTYASIHVHSESGPTEIELYLPKQDGYGEPFRAMQEEYNLESLDRAIHIVESYYK